MKKAPKVPKPVPTQKMWVVVGIALFLLIFFVIIYSSYKAGSGKAFEIKPGQTIPSFVNLVTEGSLIFTPSYLSTLSVGNQVVVTLNTEISPGSAGAFQFTLIKLEESRYSISVNPSAPAPGMPNSVDVLDTSKPDVSIFYLTTNDLLPDLKVSSQDGVITVKNLHTISPSISTIEFKTLSGTPYPFIVRVPVGSPVGSMVKGTIKVGSSSFPTLYHSFGSLSNRIDNTTGNYTAADFSFTAPTTSSPRVLTFTSVVGQQETKASYLLAVGNVTFDQNGMRVWLTESRGNKANATLKLTPTTNLQSFAPPCTLTDNSVPSLLGKLNNSRLYTYDPIKKTTMLWHQNTSIPDDFTEFEFGQGYFLQLKAPFPEILEINTTCTITEIISLRNSPISARTNMQTVQKTLSPGWNLVSVPGMIAQPLTYFTDDTQFQLHECIQSNACQSKGINQALISGQSYWVYTEKGLQLTYGIK